jgi:hypothetical protein
MVMVLMCSISAIMALQVTHSRQFACVYRSCYNYISLPSLWMIFPICVSAAFSTQFAFWRFQIPPLGMFEQFGFSISPTILCSLLGVIGIALIFSFTDFAVRLQSILASPPFMKFRCRFDLLAFRATFQYDCFSHNLTSIKEIGRAHV